MIEAEEYMVDVRRIYARHGRYADAMLIMPPCYCWRFLLDACYAVTIELLRHERFLLRY